MTRVEALIAAAWRAMGGEELERRLGEESEQRAGLGEES